MKKILILLVLLFSTSVSSLVWGEENYSDCIIKNMKGIGSDVAASEIRDACEAKHTNTTFFICVETEAQIINGIIFLPNVNEPFTGSNLCKYTDEQVKSKGRIKDGKLDGKWTAWHNNGQIKWEINYKDGKLDGKWTWRHEDGQKWEEESWENGKLVGETKYYYYENGQKKEEKNYTDDKRDGKWTWWYEDGQIEQEDNYKDGKQDGKWTWWYEDGQKWEEESWENGKLVGETKYY
jgi:antitoxin component YwqK of YwqJK toxin-antitoxin module